ncbi:Gfo/Idh/MocA family oxidoreductase, partial [Acidobacteria bacterium AH-259-L09]|nr:Gfo/Idh/MocA family oxidoreductase [Acidobacteria bacterium AH-259-L09]
MSKINRREFVKRSAATTAVVPILMGPNTWAGANNRVQVACVGLRGQGRSHIENFQKLPGVEVVALCDIDERVLADRLKDFKKQDWRKPKTYTDIRKLLEDPSIDAVSFATPNHWHALGTIWACQAGKDVYVEKPASYNIWEGRKMIEAARQYKRVVQVGHQIRSSIAVQAAVKFLQSGQLGDVYLAKGLCYKWRDTIGRTPEEPIPAGVHYDIWLGPAPKRPFTKNRFHYDWHWHWDYGNGDIGNQGVHQMDVARWGLGLDVHPVKLCSMGGHVMFEDDQETPNVLHAQFEYPQASGPTKKKLLQFEVRHWITNHEGGIGEGPDNTVGIIFYGSEGYMVIDSYSSWRVYYGRKREPGPHAKAEGSHHQNFIDAVRAQDASGLNCDIEEGHKSAVLCHLANISYRLGRSLEFDPKTERFVNDEEANMMLSR